MDFSESTKAVYNRIQKVEPENVSKIIGYLLLQDHGEREMIRLAFSPDNMIQSLINKAKIGLGLSSRPMVSTSTPPTQLSPTPALDIPLHFTPFSPASSRSFSSPASFGAGDTYWDLQNQHDFVSQNYQDPAAEDYGLHNQFHFLTLEDQLESDSSDFSTNYYYHEPALGPRTSRRSPSLPEFPLKVCHYHNKGYCKHGSNCRYFHAQPTPESFSQIYSPGSSEVDDHVFSPGSLEKLEVELTELLKARRGFPVSIASLPMMYYEKYGRTLQAEGYLTESQRHGKAGFSLTKLLARLKNSIRLIDRPHGQHSVILAEDVPKFMEYANERSDPGGIVSGSRQIYLTFPAESTFSEQDVSNYFSKFGPVQDVRIPCQQKRMFGFVTFVSPDTVRQILAKGNPHFVCGARVLVKPYREKSRLVDRKFADKIQHHMYCNAQFLDEDPDILPIPRSRDSSRLLRKQFMEAHEQVLELERRRFAGLQLTPKTLRPHPYFGYSMDELNTSEEQAELASAERFNHFMDIFNQGSSTTEDKVQHICTNYGDQESSQGLNLPENPFASPISNGISTVI